MTLISGILVAYTMVQSTGLDEWGEGNNTKSNNNNNNNNNNVI
jgi:hypothetical protein